MMTVFIRAFDGDRLDDLSQSIYCLNNGIERYNVFIRDSDTFANIPNIPFSYWVADEFIEAFSIFESFDNNQRTAKLGASTKNNFRFLRLFWEIEKGSQGWEVLAKGGDFSRWYSDYHLLILWTNNAHEIEAELLMKFPYLGDNAEFVLHRSNPYFRPGITWSQRTQKGFSARVMPKGCIFTDKGPGVTFKSNDEKELLATLAVMNSSTFMHLLKMQLSFGSYEVGVIQRTPVPTLKKEDIDYLSSLALAGWKIKSKFYKIIESSSSFIAPSIVLKKFIEIDPDASSQELTDIQRNIDDYCFDLYGVKNRNEVEHSIDDSLFDSDLDGVFEEETAFVSWAVGVVFGRFEWRLDNLKKNATRDNNPFDTQNVHSPSVLHSSKDQYKENLGILTSEDLILSVSQCIGEFGENIVLDLKRWIDKEFFEYSLKVYTKSRRQAPIYWPLQTPSGSYTLWVYYHSLNEQTLYTCVNDFVEPELAQAVQGLNRLRTKSSRSIEEEKELEKLSDFASELSDFQNELLRLAKFWKPNLNDGVQITAAPLWKLFQHKAWQKKLKETWESLEQGEYDWAHLACCIWPERVLRKCHQDRSLAIAHDLEGYFWHEVEVPVKRGAKATGQTKFEWKPRDLTESEISNLVKQIKEDKAL